LIADGFEALRDAALEDGGPDARDATPSNGRPLRDAGDGGRIEVVARLRRLASAIHP